MTQLEGQTVVVIGGSAGIGLEAARAARAAGAEVILTGRTPERLERAGRELGALSTAAFDASDFDRVAEFFADLPGPIDHVILTAGRPYYAPLAEIDFDEARANLEHAVLLPIHIAREAAGRIRPGGALLLMSGTGGRRPSAGFAVIGAATAALPAIAANLAIEIAPVRVNVIAAGFVDTPLSADLLGDQLDARRAELRATLPIGRVVGPVDVARLAIQLMANTALTGATYDIDGGQQLLPR
jgi:NAD(P)-dependent dehydrogenase (short-subunit alcohol dehydrogenase family)